MNNDITSEERLLILLTLASPTGEEKKGIQTLSSRNLSWKKLYSLAEENATVPLVQQNLEKHELFEAIPPNIRILFQEKSDRVRRANEERLQAAKKLFAKFEEKQVPVVILKGVLFAETIYANSYYKKMNDVDILIRQEDLNTVYDIYEELDYFSMGELLGDHR